MHQEGEEKMAQVYGSAGKSAFAMGETRYQDLISRIVLPMLSFLLLLPVGYYLLTRGHLFWGAVVAVIYVVSIKSLEETGLKFKKRITDADTGAKAEQAVAEALQELPDDYHVFHDLEFPSFNIDHVVLGPNDTSYAQAAGPKDLATTLQSLLSGNNSQYKKSENRQIQWPVLTLKFAACALAALLLIGAYKTMQGTVTSIFTPPQTNQIPSGFSRLQPVIQTQTAPIRQDSSTDFPLTHAVASKGMQNAIPFNFQEDRGQNVILILFNPQTNKLILRACVRAGEKLTSKLPQGEMAFLIATGPSWRGFDELFGENTDTRKARTVLSSSPKQGTILKFNASTSLLFQHGAQSPLPEAKALVDFAFKRSNNL